MGFEVGYVFVRKLIGRRPEKHGSSRGIRCWIPPKCVHRIKGHNKHFTMVATIGIRLKALMSVAVPKIAERKVFTYPVPQMLIHRPSDGLHVAGLSLWDVLGSHWASL